MANLKLVGAVAIKVRPDATGFRKETQAEITKELRDVKATVPVEAELESEKAKGDAKKLQKELDNKEVHWNVKLDDDSVRAAQKKFDELFKPTRQIKFKMGSPEEIEQARKDLEDMASKAKVEMRISEDKKGFEQVLAKIEEIRRRNIEIPVEFTTDEDGPNGLKAMERQMRDRIVRIPAKFEYNQNVEGLRKVISEIDAEMQRLNKVETEVILRPANLAFEKAKMEAELGNLTVNIEYENDLASLEAARRKIVELLPEKYRTSVEVGLDERSLLETLAKFDALIALHRNKEIKADIEPKVKPNLSQLDAFKVRAELALLARDIFIGVHLRLPLSEVAFVAAKLTGLRAAARWSEELGRALGTLDRNLPAVAAVVLTMTELSKTLVNLTADAFSLGNGLGEVVRMAGVLLPTAILSLGAVMVVMKGVFKDFGAAVNGDDKAIEKLTESGKKAAANIRVTFQDIRETVSKNFWKEAGDGMLRFTEFALPQVRDGLANLATQLGTVFQNILDSAAAFGSQSGFTVFFANLNAGFHQVSQAAGPFMTAFLNMAAVGSSILPRLGKALADVALRFDAWSKRVQADGSLKRWIDQGIDGLQNLFSIAGNLVKIWGNIGAAAQAAGALTLTSFAAGMEKIEKITAGASFQRNIRNIFEGAREGAENFRKAVDIGPVMDVFAVTISHTLANSGAAFGAFAKDVSDVLSSKSLDTGLTAFLSGLKTMFEQLRPAMAPVSEIIGTFGEILGQVATDSGPLFRNLFEQLATVLTTAWRALQPFLPALIQIGTSIVDTLGPAMTEIAETLIPAFASGLQDIGDGMVPVIKYVSDLAVGFAHWLASVPPSGIVAMATGILTLGTAFSTLAKLVPLAKDALIVFGNTAAVAGIKANLAVPVIGVLLAGLTALTAGVVTELATQQGDATPYANDWAQAIREDADATKEFGHIVQTSQIRTAVKELFDSGAIDNANALGISVQTLIDASVKGGPALTELKNRVADLNKQNNDSKAAYDKAGDGVTSYGDKLSGNNVQLQANADKGNALLGVVNKIVDSRKKSQTQTDAENAAMKAQGVFLEENAHKYDLLNQAIDKVPGLATTAASAGRALTDSFASGAAKIDAMRKSFDILVGKDSKQATAEALGAYVKGFNDIKDVVTPLKDKIQALGDAAYGENGFLNVASGNQAVLQINQALVDQVNNTWLGAKETYDQAIKQGENVKTAFAAAQQFIKDHHPDFDAIAEESGLNKDKVQGQWESIFDKTWELKVSFNGLTEVTAKVQALSNLLGLKFDGERFTAYLDANPDEAQKALTGMSDEVTINWVNRNFRAELKLLPKDVQEQLRLAVGMTEDDWVNADFATILTVAKKIPGLDEALVALYNGTHDPKNIEAIILANLKHESVEQARNELDELEAQRKAPVEAQALTDKAKEDLDRLQAERDARVIAKAETQDAMNDLGKVKDKADEVDQARPKPIVDADTGAIDGKTSNSLKLLKDIGDSRPNPPVDAQTFGADTKLQNNLGWLGEIAKAHPNPTVSVVDQASAVLRGVIGLLGGITDRQATITTSWVEIGRNPGLAAAQDGIDFNANGNILKFANGGIHRYAGGGIENHVAQIQRAGGPVRVWAEPETKAEAYIPYAQAKRPRSTRILGKVASDFGYDLVKRNSASYANGGVTGPASQTNHRTASVHIGQLITTDPEQAVRKIRISQQDALAVAGISLNGA